jgi:hypothetical protein
MIEAAEDAGAADWFSRAAEGDGTISFMVPEAFERYARVFHPAQLCGQEVRWAAVAAANGRTMHGAAEWGQLTGSWMLREQEGLWDEEPATGAVPQRLALRLASVLADHTTTPERCWFAIWDGWGDSTALVLFSADAPASERAQISAAVKDHDARAARWGSFVRGAPAFHTTHDRRMHLLTGTLDEFAQFFEPGRNPPAIWWPDDRAWCVGGDVDLMSTYVGGGADAIDAIVRDTELEALAIPPRQGVTIEADTINPPVAMPH